MAKEGRRGIIKYTVIVVSVILACLIIFGKPFGIINTIAEEGIKIEDTFGKKTLNMLDRNTLKFYDEYVIQSGLYATIWHTIIPTKKEQQLDVKDKIVKGVQLWAQDRINIIFILMFLLIQRAQLILLLSPSATFILIASVLTGFFIRKIKQGNFAFASPTAHRYAIGSLTIFLSTLPFTLMIPITIHPLVFPIAFIVISILIQLIIANLSKRI